MALTLEKRKTTNAREKNTSILQPDSGQSPLGFAAGDQNLYRYVGNSPTNNVDPSGLDSVPLVSELAPGQTPGLQPLFPGNGPINIGMGLPAPLPAPPAAKPSEPLPGTYFKPGVLGSPIPNVEANPILYGWRGVPAIFGVSLQDVATGRFPNKLVSPDAIPSQYLPFKTPLGTVGTNIAAGTHQYFTLKPNSNVVGTGGAGPCVAVIIHHPDKDGTIFGAVYHFYVTDDATKTLMNAKWPKGAQAIIAGGNDSDASIDLFWEVLETLDKKMSIPYKLAISDNIYLASDGKWYVLPPRK